MPGFIVQPVAHKEVSRVDQGRGNIESDADAENLRHGHQGREHKKDQDQQIQKAGIAARLAISFSQRLGLTSLCISPEGHRLVRNHLIKRHHQVQADHQVEVPHVCPALAEGQVLQAAFHDVGLPLHPPAQNLKNQGEADKGQHDPAQIFAEQLLQRQLSGGIQQQRSRDHQEAGHRPHQFVLHGL